jgi:hypothetical protein
MAGVLTAAFAGLVSVCAGFAAKLLTIVDDAVAVRDFTFAVRTGAGGGSRIAHRVDT